MAKAKRMMQENIKLIDVIIELVDARIPLSSKNPDIDSLAANKSRVLLLNKYDMADPKYNELWKKHFEEKGYHTALINSRNGQGVKQIKDIVYKACAAKIERDRKRGIINRPVRAMVVGIPNVGKSTFINSFVGKASTRTGNKPGVTKGKQWIRLSDKIELLDTPGILWPKFENPAAGVRLAFIGSINDDIIQMTELSLELILFLSNHYPNAIKNRYDIEVPDIMKELKDGVSTLKDIAIKRGCLMKGGEPDLERAAGLLLDDFRSVKLEKITLEFPQT
jgi:ribosome biogenesis GTPase A